MPQPLLFQSLPASFALSESYALPRVVVNKKCRPIAFQRPARHCTENPKPTLLFFQRHRCNLCVFSFRDTDIADGTVFITIGSQKGYTVSSFL